MDGVLSAQGVLLFVHIFLGGLVSFLIGIWVVPYAIRLAHARRIVDAPDDGLKRHKAPVPYLGGLAVVVACMVGLAITLDPSWNISMLCIGSILLAILGLADDLQPLPVRAKLIGQAVVAVCFLKGGLHAKQHVMTLIPSLLGSFLLYIASWGWIVCISNAFNVIDVMDGLCATTALGVCLGLGCCAFITHSWAALALLACMAGALAAFLKYNQPPARIYLGDSGSLFIGGTLSVVPFMIAWQSQGVALGAFAAILIFFIPLAEVAALILIRTYQGIPWYQGSRHHFAHFLLARNWRIQDILQLTFIIGAIVAVIAALFVDGRLSLPFVVALAAVIATGWAWVIYR